MASASYIVVLLVISRLLLVCSAAEKQKRFNPNCPSFPCGKLGQVSFPFSNRTHPECGLCIVDDCNEPIQKIQLGKKGPWFYSTSISQYNTVVLQDTQDQQLFPKHSDNDRSCKSFKNLTLFTSPFLTFTSNQTLFKCPQTPVIRDIDFSFSCNDSTFYLYHPNDDMPSLPSQCSLIHPQTHTTPQTVNFSNFFTGLFSIEVHVPRACYECHWNGGRCLTDSKGNVSCSVSTRGNGNSRFKIGLGLIFCSLGIGVGLIILIAVLFIYIILLRKKIKYASPNLDSGNNSSNLSSRSDLEATDNAYFGVLVFSYSELEEATGKFSHEKELGDGGFGTVYYGKLKDGREVAVKRLYEHNYRRVEQFMNEIEILTRLRHKNLVSLYGCTSRHSQRLLLVYEYISNGTVADHLHGIRAKPGVVTWPIRMNIAIETASALSYLHACDTIHRDVKTNNILLDNNFCVKVADFGISRLFPTDVTHVSTAPQGTPGYVDPEYHQCYQLTDKSDVYSFGVVLIELISSMPAVDITRHRHEINLSNLAMNRIQNCEIDELVDPYLGFQSDEEVKRMVTSVAELAFQCLQQNKDIRPTMDEVLEELKRIKGGESKLKESKAGHNDDDGELKSMPPDSALLKNIRLPPSSPISVTAKWVSSDSTAPHVSA